MTRAEKTCECGCGEPTRPASTTDHRTGAVKGRPQRFLPGHNRRNAQFEVSSDGCWLWLGKLSVTGYGTVTRSGRRQRAHRYFYELACGPVREGFDLDHLCRNRACVNPDHLEPVTRAENLRRGKGTRLTWSDVRAIRATAASAGEIARQFGVGKTTVLQIRRHETWRVAA